MVYKDCNIGSAKPNKNVLEKYPHHLIDIVSPNEVFNVSDFCKYSKKIIEKTHSKNKLPIFVGGSMMYFKSLYSGLYDLPERDQEFRESLKKLQSNGNDFFLYNKLNQIDPDYASKIHKNLKNCIENKNCSPTRVLAVGENARGQGCTTISLL